MNRPETRNALANDGVIEEFVVCCEQVNAHPSDVTIINSRPTVAVRKAHSGK